jgi:hypothetical protein
MVTRLLTLGNGITAVAKPRCIFVGSTMELMFSGNVRKIILQGTMQNKDNTVTS